MGNFDNGEVEVSYWAPSGYELDEKGVESYCDPLMKITLDSCSRFVQ